MPDENLSRDKTVTRIILIYVLAGCSWIILSDRVVLWFDGSSERLTLFQTYKGWFFIVATALLLYLLIHRGIESVRRNELEKQEAGERYRNLVENANDIVYELDADGNFISINRAGEDTIGYSRNELKGKNLADIVAPAHQKYINRLLGKSSKKDPSVYEIELLKKNNDKVLIEINNRPLYLDSNLIGMQGIARDISARRAMEIKLKESEHRNRTLIETANEGVLITDEEGIITFVNEKMAEMLDYDPAEILDNYVFDFMDADSEKEARQKLERRKSGIKETFDFKFKTFEGKDLWVIVSSAPIFEDNKYVGSIAMINDITERKQAEVSLKNEQKINNATIASLPGIFYFYDESGTFLRWNHNFETVSGYTGDEISQMHPLDFFDDAQKTLLEEKINEVFECGESSVEADFVSKDDSRKPFFFTGKRLILDEKKYLIGVGIDVSDCQSISRFPFNRNSGKRIEKLN